MASQTTRPSSQLQRRINTLVAEAGSQFTSSDPQDSKLDVPHDLAHQHLYDLGPSIASQLPSQSLKITGWKLLNSILLLALGISKAVATYRGDPSLPTNLDWAIGVLWAFISYWASLAESEYPALAPWFFQYDLIKELRFGGFLCLLLALCFTLLFAVFATIIHLLGLVSELHWIFKVLVLLASVVVLAVAVVLGTLVLMIPYFVIKKIGHSWLRPSRVFQSMSGLFSSSDWSLPSSLGERAWVGATLWISIIVFAWTMVPIFSFSGNSTLRQAWYFTQLGICAVVFSIGVSFIILVLLRMARRFYERCRA